MGEDGAFGPETAAPQGQAPLLFLDVDGVLNSFTEDGEPVFLNGMPVWMPEGLTERLARVLAIYEPVWATAWRGAAHSAWRAVLGLPEVAWPYVDYRDFKLTEIIRYAGDRRWAWVDDDAKWELRELGWESGRHFDGLVLCPDPAIGLTDAHVDELVAFAEARPAPAELSADRPQPQPEGRRP